MKLSRDDWEDRSLALPPIYRTALHGRIEVQNAPFSPGVEAGRSQPEPGRNAALRSVGWDRE